MTTTVTITILTRHQLETTHTEVLSQCAQLFSNHYGIWSEHVPPPCKPGSRIKMSLDKMRTTLLFDNTCGVVVYRIDDQSKVVGHAFFCTFESPSQGTVMWITQLVVHGEHRQRGVASELIRTIIQERVPTLVGIVSSNPVSLHVVRKYTAGDASPELLRLCHQHVPVPYLQHALLVNESMSMINTQFYVDHASDPDLHEGCEYICLCIRT